MNASEPGWYRDPVPADPAAPTTLRYWDGRNWTAQVRPAPRGLRAAWRREVLAQQREQAALLRAGVPVGAGARSGRYGDAGPSPAPTADRVATPDGQRLAGWWARLAALLVDGVITSIVSAALGWHLLARIADGLAVVVRATADAARTGATPPDPAAVASSLTGPILWLAVLMWVVTFCYGVGFLKGLQATPGKLLLGLEVRLRERPGPLPWSTVLVRWLVQNASVVSRLLPLLSLPAALFVLLDGLWPLWDGRRQALHDKAAGTNVVRRRG